MHKYEYLTPKQEWIISLMKEEGYRIEKILHSWRLFKTYQHKVYALHPHSGASLARKGMVKSDGRKRGTETFTLTEKGMSIDGRRVTE